MRLHPTAKRLVQLQQEEGEVLAAVNLVVLVRRAVALMPISAIR